MAHLRKIRFFNLRSRSAIYKAAARSCQPSVPQTGCRAAAVEAITRPLSSPPGVPRIMAIERTLSILKPDATRRNLTGKINARFEERGLRIVAQRRLQLSQAVAEQFYGVHAERPFFRDLVT